MSRGAWSHVPARVHIPAEAVMFTRREADQDGSSKRLAQESRRYFQYAARSTQSYAVAHCDRTSRESAPSDLNTLSLHDATTTTCNMHVKGTLKTVAQAPRHRVRGDTDAVHLVHSADFPRNFYPTAQQMLRSRRYADAGHSSGDESPASKHLLLSGIKIPGRKGQLTQALHWGPRS